MGGIAVIVVDRINHPQAAAAAEQALAASPCLRAARREMQIFDDDLARAPMIEDDSVTRVLAAVGRRIRARPRETVMSLLLGHLPLRLAGALCVALVVLGWVAGGLLPYGAFSADSVLLAEEVPAIVEGTLR